MVKKNKKIEPKPSVKFPANILEPIGNFLRSEIEKLNRRQKELKEVDPFNDPQRLNDNAASDTEAQEQVGHEQVVALKEQVGRRLIQLRKALSRVNLGKYGICEKCKKMIDTDRLMAMPEATLCADCAKTSQR
jgi:DnaK suppressor protein